jgi:hypothetical protein
MQERDDQGEELPGKVRRIVVQSSLPVAPAPAIQGRRLQDPPELTRTAEPKGSTQRTADSGQPAQKPGVRKEFIVIAAAAGLLSLTVVGFVIINTGKKGPTPAAVKSAIESATTAPSVTPQADESSRIEVAAREVVRRISKDSKPYSFSDAAINDIEASVRHHSQAPQLAATLLKLQDNSSAISARAAKEGLQPSLVMLVALAVSRGGESSDALATAGRVVPTLAALNKMFGSSEADSSLILIAAFHEGLGTNRSHPLLKRMKDVVNNPLTERNVWYLHDRNVLSEEDYELVVDALAYGVIARNPKQFGLENDPLNL